MHLNRVETEMFNIFAKIFVGYERLCLSVFNLSAFALGFSRKDKNENRENSVMFTRFRISGLNVT